jgi:hypothetical protein
MTTTVKKASSLAVFSKENSASLVDATIFYPKIFNSSDEPLASSKISSTSPDSLGQEFYTTRVSKRANKAS